MSEFRLYEHREDHTVRYRARLVSGGEYQAYREGGGGVSLRIPKDMFEATYLSVREEE